jgi:hypothetical protein
MNINFDQNVCISAQWIAEVCTPTETGTISEYPFGTGFQNNAILNYFLSGIILHLHDARDPKMFYPARFTDGSIELGTGIKPISYNDRALDKFYQSTSYVRPLGDRVNIQYITESGMAIFEKTYDFPTSPGIIKYTEAGFKQVDAATDWSAYRVNPIYSRFLFTKETEVTGYISGILNESGMFETFEHPLNQVSGVFYLDGSGILRQGEINKKTIRREFVTGFISGYLSFLNQFSPFTSQQDRASGYFLSGEQKLFPPKFMPFPENITGFISGNMTELSGFIHYTGDIAASGYRLENNWYNFNGPFNQFSGLSGFEYGYYYSGFDFSNASGFIADIENELYGAGKLTGLIGNRNILKISGQFNNFSGELGFDNRAGHDFFMFFMSGSGFGSGFIQDPGQPIFGQLKFGTGKMTGIIGYRNIFTENIYSGLSGIPTHEYGWYFIKSGMFGADNHIVSGKYNVLNNYLTTGFSGQTYQQTNLVLGFISGYQSENGQFSPFFGSKNTSGYFNFNGEKFYFPTGAAFGGFSNDINFIGKPFSYTGFSFPIGSGFSGLYYQGSGTGIMTGYIGHVVETFYKNTGIGTLTGIIGYKKYISPITLNLGQYIKIKYRIAFRVPQYVQETLVTGDGLVYGDFNASGKLKFVGPMEQIFGKLREDELNANNGTAEFTSSSANGIWWPVTDPIGGGSYPYPAIGLCATMLNEYEALNNNPEFPITGARPRFYLMPLDPLEQLDESTMEYYMMDPFNKYPLKHYNTLYSMYSGGYHLENLFIFTADFPNRDENIGGIWFSPVRYVPTRNGPWLYFRPTSGSRCGWMYKFNSPQKKWEDQALYITTKFKIEKDQLFEDPYYGRYPQ